MWRKQDLQAVANAFERITPQTVPNPGDTALGDMLYATTSDVGRALLDEAELLLRNAVMECGAVNRRAVTELRKLGLDIRLAGDPHDPWRDGVAVTTSDGTTFFYEAR